jgi:MFS family permease
MAMGTICYLAFVSYIAVTALVPGTLPLAKQFNVPKPIAVYLGNTPVALYAVGPFLWSPMSHFTGRRPVMLISNVIAIVGSVVAASAGSYGACMVGRVIMGLGGSAFWCLGPASIGDIVCLSYMIYQNMRSLT